VKLLLLSCHKDGATGSSATSRHICDITRLHNAQGPNFFVLLFEIKRRQDKDGDCKATDDSRKRVVLQLEFMLAYTIHDFCFGWVLFVVHDKDLNLRKKLVKCYIWSVALCGAETWTLGESGSEVSGKF
jgi:hypothetical protein